MITFTTIKNCQMFSAFIIPTIYPFRLYIVIIEQHELVPSSNLWSTRFDVITTSKEFKVVCLNLRLSSNLWHNYKSTVFKDAMPPLVRVDRPQLATTIYITAQEGATAKVNGALKIKVFQVFPSWFKNRDTKINPRYI